MGLAQGPDGSLYISESNKGKIWRVMFKGDKTTFGVKQLAKMKKRAQRTYVKVPDEIKDNLDYGKPEFKGQMIYQTYCRACHQRDGKGDGTRFPPLAQSEWVNGDKEKLISVLLKGMNEPIQVAGKEYSGAMPPFNFLTDSQMADLLNYIRTNFNNKADSVLAEEVNQVRSKPAK
jgi:mono/diheme cytochrome c family protein